MKKKILYLIPTLVFIWAGITSCNDSFLDRDPVTDITGDVYWKTLNQLELFANGIYNEAATNSRYEFMLGHTHDPWASNTHAAFWWDVMTDNFVSRSTNHAWAAQISAGQNTIPSSETLARGTWQWEVALRCNTLILNYNQVEGVTQEEKNWYAGEAYLFRAWFYYDKVQKYGGVPWINEPLNTESEDLYKPRDTRELVVDSILKDINTAIEYLPTEWKGKEGRVDKGVALALKSRICLYEGTYRKYHSGFQDSQKFLEACVDASEKLIALGKYEIYNTGNPESDYATLFISEDLSTNKEMIFFRKYTTGILGHRLCGYLVQSGTGATKDFVDDFLCLENGKALPLRLTQRYQNGEYEPVGDYQLKNIFKDRDPRLSQIVLDPEKSKGFLFNRDQFDFPRITGMTGWESATGYHVIKYYDKVQDAKGYGNESHDAPLFRYAEVLLNLAEAQAELGKCDQKVLDKTINQLRDRAGMPHLKIGEIPVDTKFASEGLSPLLVEIRRERRVELCFEQMRYQDLMRWKKGTYLQKDVVGMRFERAYIDQYDHFGTTDKIKESVHSALRLIEVDGKNYLSPYGGTNYSSRDFDEDKNYLWPIPLVERSRNPKLEQNPKW